MKGDRCPFFLNPRLRRSSPFVYASTAKKTDDYYACYYRHHTYVRGRSGCIIAECVYRVPCIPCAVLLSLGDRGTSNEQENKRNRGGGTAFRNRATRKPPRPQHLDCNLALIDIQIVIPEQLGSTEIVHGQLSLDCALPSAPPSGIFQAHIAKTTEGMPDSVLGCVSKSANSLSLSPPAPNPPVQA